MLTMILGLPFSTPSAMEKESFLAWVGARKGKNVVFGTERRDPFGIARRQDVEDVRRWYYLANIVEHDGSSPST